MAALATESRQSQMAKSGRFLFSILAMVAIAMVIGQKLAIPIFMAYYLIRWGKYDWKISFAYAAVGWIILVGFYDRVMHLFWHRPLLEDALISLMPDGFPQWLIL